MDANSYKTVSARAADVERKWYVVDAENQVVGRLASKVAHILRGKHQTNFTPHVDVGDFVIVINAEKARFTGAKETNKFYFTYSGYPGGQRFESPKQVRTRKPAFVVEHAIKGMLPKGALGRDMFRKLKVYAGAEHPHQAQQPEPLEL
jgi:large subunit ribosomal protein L13